MPTEGLDRLRSALVPHNPKVQKLAKRLRWKPERTIERIKRALPAPIEQQIYLSVASDFGILPESMAKLLRYYLGQEKLELDDLEPHSIGNNLVISKFATFAEFLRECLNLIKIVAREYTAFSITYEQAAVIVTHYGTDEPELLIEMVDNNLEELCELLGVSNERSYSERMRIYIWLVASKVIPENRANGRPDILNISDILEISSEQRRQLRLSFLEELRDFMSADAEELGWHESFALLKKERII